MTSRPVGGWEGRSWPWDWHPKLSTYLPLLSVPVRTVREVGGCVGQTLRGLASQSTISRAPGEGMHRRECGAYKTMLPEGGGPGSLFVPFHLRTVLFLLCPLVCPVFPVAFVGALARVRDRSRLVYRLTAAEDLHSPFPLPLLFSSVFFLPKFFFCLCFPLFSCNVATLVQ